MDLIHMKLIHNNHFSLSVIIKVNKNIKIFLNKLINIIILFSFLNKIQELKAAVVEEQKTLIN